MKLPKMILFDYGHTLCHETGFDTNKGTVAVMKYIKSNPKNYSCEEISDFSKKLFEQIRNGARKNNLEIHNQKFQQMLYEYLEIEIDLTQPQIEKIFWDNSAPGGIMPNADKMIDFINSAGIRSGVISNVSFSGEALSERINRILPNNKFEFIIASSEYVFRKPEPLIFELALKKAHLNPDEVWYCGDNPIADAEGSSGVEMFPVWYHSSVKCDYHDKKYEIPPKCEHLLISDWNDFILFLKNLM